MKTLSLIAFLLVLVGALNWGLVALLDLDLVAALFGTMPTVQKIVYLLVGASALYVAYVRLPKELKMK